MRLDLLLVARGLAPTRERARALIMAGRTQVDGKRVDKAGTAVADDARVEVAAPPCPYVSRGGLKLDGALNAFPVPIAGRVAADLGSSTGGFTHCLLERGIARVYAVDVGRGQLDWGLRSDPRIIVREGVNARALDREILPEPVEVSVIDLAFISVRLVLPALLPLLTVDSDVLVLVKPQFELGRGEVGRGIVRDPALHARALTSVAEAARALELRVRGVCASPISGAKGNREFFLWLTPAGEDCGSTLEDGIAMAVAPPEPR